MNIQTFLQLTKLLFCAPREAARRVASAPLEGNMVWGYLAAGYVVAEVAFYALLRIPGHAAFIGEEDFMTTQYNLAAIVGDAFFVFVVFFAVYKGLVYFGKQVPLPQYALLTGLMYVMSIGIALMQAPFLLFGYYGFSYVVMLALLLYMLIVWIKAESELFAVGVWKVFFINTVIMIALGAAYAIIFEAVLA